MGGAWRREVDARLRLGPHHLRQGRGQVESPTEVADAPWAGDLVRVRVGVGLGLGFGLGFGFGVGSGSGLGLGLGFVDLLLRASLPPRGLARVSMGEELLERSLRARAGAAHCEAWPPTEGGGAASHLQ